MKIDLEKDIHSILKDTGEIKKIVKDSVYFIGQSAKENRENISKNSAKIRAISWLLFVSILSIIFLFWAYFTIDKKIETTLLDYEFEVYDTR